MMQPVGKKYKRGLKKHEIVFEIFDIKVLVAQVYIGFFPSFNKASFIPAFPPPRGGVTGRELFNDGVLVFFSDGFKI